MPSHWMHTIIRARSEIRWTKYRSKVIVKFILWDLNTMKNDIRWSNDVHVSEFFWGRRRFMHTEKSSSETLTFSFLNKRFDFVYYSFIFFLGTHICILRVFRCLRVRVSIAIQGVDGLREVYTEKKVY